MQFQFKNIVRCNSQQINQTQVNQSRFSQKSQKASDLSTQLHDLLYKIQAINNTRKQQDQPQKKEIRFIAKQGKTQDEPHRPSVLSVNKYKKSKQVSEKSSPVESKHQEMMIHVEKQSTGNLNNFYKYCTDEIVRVSTQNSNLQKNLQKTLQNLQNEKKTSENLKKENDKLVKQLNQYKHKFEHTNQQVLNLKYQLQQLQRQGMAKQKQQIDLLAQKTKIYETQLNKYRKIIAQKDEQNSKLINEIKTMKIEAIQNIQIAEQNKRLGKKVAQLMNSNKSWQDKTRGKTEAIDHLWSIKEIQYGNIVELISLAKKK